MNQQIKNGLSGLCITVLFIALLCLMVIRLGFPQLPRFTDEIVQFVSERSGLNVQVESLDTYWQGAYPVFLISGLHVTAKDTPERLYIKTQHIDATVDFFRSLFYWQPIFKSAVVDGLALGIAEPEGGWAADKTPSQTGHSRSVRDVIDSLSTSVFAQSHISISNAEFVLMLADGQIKRFSPVALEINNTRQQHQVVGQATLENTEGKSSSATFVIEADRLPSSTPLDGDFSIYARVSDVGAHMLDIAGTSLPVKISSVDASAELWAYASKRHLTRLQGGISVKKLSFADDRFDNIVDSAFNFSAEPRADNSYQLQVSELNIVSERQSTNTLFLPYITALIGFPAPSSPVVAKQVAIKSIPLESLTAWLKDKQYLPESINQAISLLNAKGALDNLVVTWRDGAKLLDFMAVADLVGVGLDEYYGSPSVSNVSGQLVFNKSQGHVDLDTTNVELSFPSLFETGWHFGKAQGRVKWNIERPPGFDLPVVIVNSGLLTLSEAVDAGASDIKGDTSQEAFNRLVAAGRFRLMLPIERMHQSEFSLMIGLQNGHANQAAGYVPAKEVGESLHAWIKRAVKSGTVKQGVLLLRTDTRKLDGRTPPTVQLYLDIAQGEVEFLEQWPAVSETDMTMWLDQEGLRIRAEDAKIMNSTGRVVITSPPDVSKLKIEAYLSGQARDIQQILNTPDIRQVVGDGLENWRINGAQTTDITVDVALMSKQAPVVSVVSRLRGGSFKDKAETLAFTNINGTLQFSTAKGLSATGLKSQFLGSRVVGGIVSIPATAESPALTRVSLKGQLSAAALHKWTALSFLNSVKGSTVVSGRMDICEGSPLCNKLVVNTNLEGVELLLPKPFGKTAKETKSLQLVGQLGINDPVWRFNLNDQMRGVTKMMGEQAGTRIYLGDVRPQEPSTPGVWVEGRQATINLDELSALLKRNEWLGDASAESSEGGTDVTPVTVSLMVDQVLVDNLRIPHVDLVYHSTEKGSATIGLMSPVVTGDIKIPEDSQKPYKVSLKHLRLDQKGEKSVIRNKVASSDPSLIDTSEWPDIDFSIDELQLNGRVLGSWQAQLRPDQKGQLIAKDIKAKIDSYTLTGEAGWHVKNQTPRSYLDVVFSGNDLGKVIALWGYEGVIESSKGSLKAQLNWEGYPWGFSAENLGGSFIMSLKNGRIVESGDSANILRLFGILNFNTIVRRLKLNFTDLVEKGVAYDSLNTSFLIKDGVAHTDKPLSLEGPSADLKLNGKLYLTEQTIEATMEVVLPLTSNLPIAAVLMGAPQIAGAVFIIDKLIGDKLEKVTTLTYQVDGPWAEPNVDTVVSEEKKKRNDPFRMDRNDK